MMELMVNTLSLRTMRYHINSYNNEIVIYGSGFDQIYVFSKHLHHNL